MVQVIQKGPSLGALTGQMLGQSLGQGLGNFMGNYQANKALEGVINNPELQNASPSERLQALTSALSKHGERGQKVLQNALMGEQQRMQEKRSQVLSKIYKKEPLEPGEERYLDSKDYQDIRRIQVAEQQKPIIKKSLVDAGVSEEQAEALSDLYANASIGGQTELMKPIADLISRQGQMPGKTEEIETSEEEWPDISEGFKPTPAESFKISSKRESVNIPLYNENEKKLHSLEAEGMKINRLQQLNPKMPEGLFGKANIEIKSGELRIPAGASPEVQLYVKTLNDFLINAKDSFGARVTNFDLASFMKRLPTLANSKEGRELILKQMQVINELNQFHDRSLKEVYDHYGVGKINAQQARQIADKRSANEKQNLVNRYTSLDGLLKDMETGKTNEKAMISMIAPDGRKLNVPESEVKRLEELGAKRG
jgi:hypothetical protein